jgi:hypothetical protein
MKKAKSSVAEIQRGIAAKHGLKASYVTVMKWTKSAK